VKVRFQADAGFDRRIAHATLRRETSIDLQLAAAVRDGVGLRDVPDDRVLAEAAREGRILLSHDHRTMPRHFATFIALQRSPGVIIMPQRMGILLAMEWIVTIWGASEA
jgi:predicted nuclease of predicted toxin-antitoxin system